MNTTLENPTETVSSQEPVWLAERRSAGTEQFKNLPMPSARDEEWRFASVGKLSIDDYNPADAPTGATLDALVHRSDLVSEQAGRMVYVDDAPALFHMVEHRGRVDAHERGLAIANLRAEATSSRATYQVRE